MIKTGPLGDERKFKGLVFPTFKRGKKNIDNDSLNNFEVDSIELIGNNEKQNTVL